MKNALIIIALFTFSLVSCKDKKATENSMNTEQVEEIKEIEQENLELQKLDKQIETDIKEIDDLLESIDK